MSPSGWCQFMLRLPVSSTQGLYPDGRLKLNRLRRCAKRAARFDYNELQKPMLEAMEQALSGFVVP